MLLQPPERARPAQALLSAESMSSYFPTFALSDEVSAPSRRRGHTPRTLATVPHAWLGRAATELKTVFSAQFELRIAHPSHSHSVALLQTGVACCCR